MAMTRNNQAGILRLLGLSILLVAFGHTDPAMAARAPRAGQSGPIEPGRFLPIRVPNVVATNRVSVVIEPVEELPSIIGFVLNSTNLADAEWIPFADEVELNLPAGSGTNFLWIGARWPDGRQAAWSGHRVIVDLTPPAFVITHPVGRRTSQPLVQLKGWCPEPISESACKLAGPDGEVSTPIMLVMRQHYDVAQQEFTTNWFQCFDLDLKPGTNIVTLSAKDRAGNLGTTNFTLVFSTQYDKTPPLITLISPMNNEEIFADAFTARLRVDDPTATVVGLISAEGNTNLVEGLVERDGLVWLQNLPLRRGQNVLVITASDVAGNVSRTNLVVFQSHVRVVIHPPPPEALTGFTVDLTGTINVSNYSVWINGTRAEVKADGSWVARQVPVNEGGTAVFEAKAIPNEPSGAPSSRPGKDAGSR